MSQIKAKEMIENSFLKPLLKDPAITDISYNGESLYYQHNLKGRQKYNQPVTYEMVFDLVRQLSNLCEKFFSIAEPILDVSVDKYRINAVHPSIARVGNNKAITLSIRIASKSLRILNDEKFMSMELANFLKRVIDANQSIVISGLTGTGKTELQKFLLAMMKDNSRIIIIDNVLELDQVRLNKSLDVNSWQYDERNKVIDISALIKNALRSNPDWLIVAEARGHEMIDVLNSALTGIPIITTLHSESAETIVNRMVSMVKMNDKKMEDEQIKQDIYSHIHFYIYIKKRLNEKNEIQRYISKVIYINAKGETYTVFDIEQGKKRVVINSELSTLLLYKKEKQI